jgi:hypothetical protein
MRKLRLLLPLALIAAAIAVPSASPAPSPVKLSISSNAQYVSPTTILVPVTITCPAGQTAFVSLTVQEQNATNSTGSGFTNAVCTGSAQTLAVVVNGTGFTPGKAYVTGFADAGFFFDQDTRQIQIVV